MNGLQLICKRIVFKAKRTRIVKFVSEGIQDKLTDLRFAYLRLFKPYHAPYDSRTEDRLLRDLELMQIELTENVICVGEMIKIKTAEEEKLKLKHSDASTVDQKKKLENQHVQISKYISRLKEMHLELVEKRNELHLKEPILRAKIRSIIITETVENELKKYDSKKVHSLIDKVEKNVTESEKNAGPLPTAEDVKKKQLLAEDALEELELIRQLLEKMDKFIQANEKI